MVVTRPLKGKTPQHYSFNIANPTLPYINAVGKGPVFAYHKSKARLAARLPKWLKARRGYPGT